MFRLRITMTLTFEKLTCFCMPFPFVILYQYVVYNQTDWITEQMENVFEKGSAYLWEIMRGQKRG